MPRGGARPGAGKPKGYKHPPTQKLLEKAAARELLRQRVNTELLPLVDAQIANAKGISHFFLRAKDGTFTRITNADTIETALNSGEEGSYYYIFTKDPSVQAFTDLMNRTLDRPIEQVEVSGAGGGPVEFRWQE